MKKAILLTLAVLACTTAGLFAQEAKIRPGDAFELRISGVPPDDQSTISGSYTVDGSGLVSLSYIGKVKAADRSGSEVQTAIERAYIDQGIFTHPTISLNIAPAARFVNVGGNGVKSSARVPYTPDMTLLSAILAAGDFNDFADQAKVSLIRGKEVKVYNCKKIRQNPALDVKVLPGDTIQVPQTIF